MGKATCPKGVLFFVVHCLIYVYGAAAAVGRKDLTEIETRKELQQLNKLAIKTIKSEDGDIIDCVDIYRQPAFDHPLLKNHTIQMRPSNYDSEKMSSSEPLEQLWHKSGSCPEGTIPIRRTPKRHLLEAQWKNPPDLESARLLLDHRVQGGEGVINVWNVHVEPNELSAAAIFIGRRDNVDLLNSGWIVYKDLFGDDAPRLYAHWHTDNGGCYNLICPGFVQITQDLSLGVALTPTSTYGGEQRVITVKIYKDQANGNWWLVVNNKLLGYWPSSLFKRMAENAHYIEWGGQVSNREPEGKHTSTQMGSGHFPDEGYGKAAYFDRCVYFNDDLIGITPDDDLYETGVSKPKCYRLSAISPVKGAPGLSFYYGGPGGPNCDG